jgi:mRNA degradation ribonuclease J1/J2
MDIDEGKMVQWMDFFDIDCDFEVDQDGVRSFKRRHVSGHASNMELKDMIDRVNPARIIPIHTTNAYKFKDMFEAEVILPKYAESIEI